jgi:hypothetical protein
MSYLDRLVEKEAHARARAAAACTTHHAACACREAKRDATIARLTGEVERLREALERVHGKADAPWNRGRVDFAAIARWCRAVLGVEQDSDKHFAAIDAFELKTWRERKESGL